MKLAIWLGILVGGTFGSWLGAVLDHNNWFGLASILAGGAGSLIGIWIGYKLAKNYF